MSLKGTARQGWLSAFPGWLGMINQSSREKLSLLSMTWRLCQPSYTDTVPS